MALNNLYPPIVDTYMPAFTIDEEGKGTCRVYFALSPYNSGIITDIWVSVTDQNTNLSLLNTDTGFISYPYQINEKNLTRIAEAPLTIVGIDNSRPGDDKYYIEISHTQLRMQSWTPDRMYKVQLRLSSESFENTPGVLVGKQDVMSEWSKVCLISPILTPVLQLMHLDANEETIITSFNNVITGRVNFKDKEILESYRIKIYSLKDGSNKLEYDSDIIYTDSFAPNEIYHQLTYGLIDGEKYQLDFEYTTKSLYHTTATFNFMVIDMAGERIDATITAIPNDEMGRIEVNISSTTERYFGNLVIRRTSHKSNFTIWEDIKRITLYEASDLNITWNDYTAESGVWYKYCVQKCSAKGTRGLVVATETPVMLNLEDIYLTGGDRTLRIKFNPQINSFTHTLLESNTQTLGGKYPFIKRNGKVGYKQFSISGLISHLMDEGELFTNSSELYNNQNELYNMYHNDKGINDYNNLIIEKEFRDKVHEFLYDGEVKLFRSATEGSFLVRLMNISLTPENALGRMLYTFNATAYEIDDLTIENISKYNIHQVGELQDVIAGIYEDFGQINLSNGASLIEKLQEQENTKNEGSTLKSTIQYFNKIKIQMTSEPQLLYFDGTKYKRIEINNIKDITKEEEFYTYGYVALVSLAEEEEIKQFYINPHGYLELATDGLKITNIKWLDYRMDGSIEYHFIAEQKENISFVPSHFSIIPGAAQVYGIFNPTEEIGKFIYQKHKYKDNKKYQNLYSLNTIEIEANPNTVFYITDSSQQEAKRFVIGDSGFLRIESEDFIIKEISILGKSLREKEKDIKNNYVNRVSRNYEWTNEASLAFNSIKDIQEPIENGLYRVRSLDGVWLPKNINTPTAGNDYLKQLKNWAEPILFGQEYFYYVIYRQGQWYLYTKNEDIVMPTSAIITYYFDLEKGEYGNV